MDGFTIGPFAAVCGVLGGLFGAYRSIKNTNGPRERAFMIRVSVAEWLGVSAFLGGLVLLPMPWRPLLWIVSMPSLIYFLRKSNQRWALVKAEDQTEAGDESPA